MLSTMQYRLPANILGQWYYAEPRDVYDDRDDGFKFIISTVGYTFENFG